MQILIGVVLIVGGVILATVFGDQEFFIFRGQPLGVVLALVGVADVAEWWWRRRQSA